MKKLYARVVGLGKLMQSDHGTIHLLLNERQSSVNLRKRCDSSTRVQYVKKRYPNTMNRRVPHRYLTFTKERTSVELYHSSIQLMMVFCRECPLRVNDLLDILEAVTDSEERPRENGGKYKSKATTKVMQRRIAA